MGGSEHRPAEEELVDKNLVAKLKAIASAVSDFPEELRHAAFTLLAERALSGPAGPLVPLPITGEPVKDWASELAEAAAVDPETIVEVFHQDEEGVHVIQQDLGGKKVSENVRRIAVLYLWARRQLYGDLYVSRGEVAKQVKSLSHPITNFNNNLSSEATVRTVRIQKQTMLQLVGNWKGRAAEILGGPTD